MLKGLIILNKPKGITSHDAVYLLRKKTGIKKIGHTGTLDPMAEGVLPMCIDKATKIAEYISENNKEYIATLEFGYETDTYDLEGKVTRRCDYIPSREEILDIILEMTGQQMQIPPMYSAIKQNGKKLYELAREGITVKRKAREINIYELELLEFISDKVIKIRVVCSSGTYIRSLVRDMGEKLSSLATMTSLLRTRVGNYTLDMAIDREALDKLTPSELEEKIFPIDSALHYLDEFYLPDWFYERALNGVSFRLKNSIDEKLFRVYCRGEFLGIGESKIIGANSILKIKKLLK